MVSLGAKMQEVAGDMTRLDDVLRYPAEQQALVELAVPGAATTKLTGYLELHNISFGYSQLEPPLIEQFNLTLKPRLARGAGRRHGRWQVDAREAGDWAVRALGRRGAVRWPAAQRHPARADRQFAGDCRSGYRAVRGHDQR